MQKIAILVLLTILVACNNSNNNKPKGDSTIKVIDSVGKMQNADCYDIFFKADKKDTTNYSLVLNDGTTTSIHEFIKKEYASTEDVAIRLQDVDKDGVKELWLRAFTSGMHCCDEWKVFLPQTNGSYKLSSYLTAGDVCVENEVFTFSLSQVLGYFKSCFACGYEDSAKGFIPVREFSLKYVQGKFVVAPYDKLMEQRILKNLTILKNALTNVVDDEEATISGSMKKEFAINIAVFYFNNNKNWEASKKLFLQYYPLKDGENLAKELKALLDEVMKENSF